MNVGCISRTMVAGVVVPGLLALFSEQNQPSAPEATVSRPATPASSDARAEDTCREAVVLTLQSHSGASALMRVQNTEGQDIPTWSASTDEGRFTTRCYRPKADDPSGDVLPQFLKLCAPGTFVLRITGSGNGSFDLQAKPFPEVAL